MTTNADITAPYKGHVDWKSLAVYLLLVIAGWFNLYAAVWDDTQIATFDFSQRYGMQLIWIGVSWAVGLAIMLLDSKYYHMLAYPIYTIVLIVMLATLAFGRVVNGAKAWLVFGPVALQPTEFMKLATALALARYMSDYSFNIHRFSKLLRIGLIIALPVAIIFLQNDTGSAVVYGSFLFMLYREGLNRWVYIILGMVLLLFIGSFWLTPTALLILIILCCVGGNLLQTGELRQSAIYLAGLALCSLLFFLVFNMLAGFDLSFFICLLIATGISIPLVVFHAFRQRTLCTLLYIALFVGSLIFVSTTDYVFDHLQIHQQKRILDLFGIESDLKHWGYNVNQSKIAIGSGGFFGKGFLEGTQTKFNFVPEQSTDFIFCTVGEEWGFVGSAIVLALFCTLIVRLIKMGERQGEAFSRIYCYSVAGIFLLHVLINVGMTIGLMPVIGIPLPFFSYGGSSFLAFSLLFFIALRLDAGSGEFNALKIQ